MSENSVNEKYRLDDETVVFDGHTLHRIVALRDFGDYHAGDKGGWIESEKNLSFDGDCWVKGNAKILGGAVVAGDALISDNAVIRDNALVCQRSQVCDSATISGYALVGGNARVREWAIVDGKAAVSEDSLVEGHAKILESACISDATKVRGHVIVQGNTKVNGKGEFMGCSVLCNNRDYLFMEVMGMKLTWARSSDTVHVFTELADGGNGPFFSSTEGCRYWIEKTVPSYLEMYDAFVTSTRALMNYKSNTAILYPGKFSEVYKGGLCLIVPEMHYMLQSDANYASMVEEIREKFQDSIFVNKWHEEKHLTLAHTEVNKNGSVNDVVKGIVDVVNEGASMVFNFDKLSLISRQKGIVALECSNFDGNSAERLRAVIRDNGYAIHYDGNFRPHISLLTLRAGFDPDMVETVLERINMGLAPIQIHAHAFMLLNASFLDICYMRSMPSV